MPCFRATHPAGPRGRKRGKTLQASERQERQPVHPQVLLLGGAVLFGAMAVTTRAAASELGAAQIAAVRFALGLVGVGAVVLVRPGWFRATRPGVLFLRGLFGGGAVLGYFMAIERLGAGMGTLLNYTFPLWAAFFATFLGERLTLRLVAGMAVASLGLGVVVGPGELSGVLSGLGDERVRVGILAGLVSAVLGGLAVATMRVLRRTDSALAIFTAFCGVGLVVCLPGAASGWVSLTPRLLWLLLLVGALSFGAQVAFTYALKFVGAGAGALTTQLTVVASYGIAALTLGEPVGMKELGGGGLVMAGVLVTSLPLPRRISRELTQSPAAIEPRPEASRVR